MVRLQTEKKELHRAVWLVLAVMLCTSFAGADDNRSLKRNKASGLRRHALVIGNSAYAVGPLKNPAHDARDMAEALRAAGFSVNYLVNSTQRDMEEAIQQLGTDLRSGGVGLFYFAGHGVQVRNVNYLIPVDARIRTEADVRYEAVDANRVLSPMEEAGNAMNLVFLDACRNNPYARSFRSASQGLAQMESPSGSLVAFATGPGKVAADGPGRNGVYTKHLIRAIRTEGVEIGPLLRRVRRDVRQETGGRQIPFELSSLIGEFYFHPVATIAAAAAPAAAGPPQISGYGIDPEEELWLTVRDSGDSGDMEEYLDAYPDGRFSRTARVKIRKLKEAADRSTLTIEPEPASAKVKLLDIREKYHPGIGLSPGRYRVAVSAAGYQSKTETIEVPPATACRQKIELTPSVPRQGDEYTDPLTGMVFVYIAGGCYEMGSPSFESGSDNDEGPVHMVCVDGFYIGKYEVTNSQYRQYRSGHRSKDYKGRSLDGENQPVVYVSWREARDYASWLGSRSGKRYRLPTEAEWEYAARGGTTTSRYWGDRSDTACVYANVHDLTSDKEFSWYWQHHQCDDGYAVTAPVGRFRPNGYGLYDMLGNAWEWCSDWYGSDYYSSSPKENPSGPAAGEDRVLRGGGRNCKPRSVRSASRNSSTPGFRRNHVGFRLVLQAR